MEAKEVNRPVQSITNVTSDCEVKRSEPVKL